MRSRTLPPDAQDRLTYLSTVGSLLWPEPAVFEITGRRRRNGDWPAEEYLLVPGRARPRLLVPARAHRAAGSAVRHYGEQMSARARLQAAGLAMSAQSGVLAAASGCRARVSVPPGADTITSHLSAALDRPLLVSMHIGAARANRKPVLQLLDQRGRTVAYAKVGIDHLTSRLVRQEGDTLQAVAASGLGRLRFPEVLYRGTWRGLELLVLSALPVWQARREDPAQLTAAMVELATATSVEDGVLAGSAYRQALGERIAAMPDGPRSAAVRQAAALVDDRFGAEVFRYGAWHGDWTAWNCACLADTVLLWDWERYSQPAPLGFDALHYWMQGVMQRRAMPLPEAATSCRAQAPAVIAPFGLAPQQAVAAARLYLLDLAVRYVLDRQDAASGRFGAVEEWLLPAVAA